MAVKPVPSAAESGKMKIYNHVHSHPRSGEKWFTFYSSSSHTEKVSSLASSLALLCGPTAVVDRRMQMMKFSDATPKVAVSE